MSGYGVQRRSCNILQLMFMSMFTSLFNVNVKCHTSVHSASALPFLCSSIRVVALYSTWMKIYRATLARGRFPSISCPLRYPRCWRVR